VETIWEGDVKEFSRAYDLICIVDQIHNYAVSQHRKFVTKHLEPWLRRAEDFDEGQLKEMSYLDPFESSVESLLLRSEWDLIKEASKKSRVAKTALTRKRKTRGEGVVDTSSAEASHLQLTSQGASPSQTLFDVQVQTKQGREHLSEAATKSQSKRCRGRPRKGGN
jgi:hypothetical protein